MNFDIEKTAGQSKSKKSKKSNKALKVIGIILAVLIVLFGVLTVVSRTVYHRSNMATLAELYLRISGTKEKFEDADECAAYPVLTMDGYFRVQSGSC